MYDLKVSHKDYSYITRLAANLNDIFIRSKVNSEKVKNFISMDLY